MTRTIKVLVSVLVSANRKVQVAQVILDPSEIANISSLLKVKLRRVLD
jgi:hypothetical protein